MGLVVLLLLCVAALPAYSTEWKSATFKSPPIPLRSGEVANTPPDWGPLPFLTSPAAVRNYSAVIVDDNDNPIPLSELYIHHWVIFSDFGDDNAKQIVQGLCFNVQAIWGIGAELHHTHYEYPDPYAIIVDGTEKWSANLHFIRTTNVPDVQKCIECHCSSGHLPDQPHGSVGCCPDHSMCWGMTNKTYNDTKNYYLKYTVVYTDITSEVKPLSLFWLDATASNTYDCKIEYDMVPIKKGQYNVIQSNSTIPSNWSVVYMQVHQHTGGVKFTVEHFRGDQYLGQMFQTAPIYGSGGKGAVGNETGYLVAIPTTTFSTPYELQAGDLLQLTSWYDSRHIPDGHGWHEGIMSLLYIAAHASPNPKDKCIDNLHKVCGKPPYKTNATCLACADKYAQNLTDAGCTDAMLIYECAKTGDDGNIPTPDSINDVAVSILGTSTPGQVRVFMEGPTDAWFALAYNPDSTLMQNSRAWVWSRVSKYGNRTVGAPTDVILQERKLGNHAAGDIVVANYTVNVDTDDTRTRLEFNITNWSRGDKDCWLMARGDQLSGLFLGYHGAFRGSSCGYSSKAMTKDVKPYRLPMFHAPRP